MLGSHTKRPLRDTSRQLDVGDAVLIGIADRRMRRRLDLRNTGLFSTSSPEFAQLGGDLGLNAAQELLSLIHQGMGAIIGVFLNSRGRETVDLQVSTTGVFLVKDVVPSFGLVHRATRRRLQTNHRSQKCVAKLSTIGPDKLIATSAHPILDALVRSTRIVSINQLHGKCWFHLRLLFSHLLTSSKSYTLALLKSCPGKMMLSRLPGCASAMGWPIMVS